MVVSHPDGFLDGDSVPLEEQSSVLVSGLGLFCFFVYLTEARVNLEEVSSAEKMPPPGWPVNTSVAHFLD